MKKLLISLLAIGLVSTAQAQTVESDLVGLGMNSELASYIAGILPAGSTLGNNTYLKARNAANSADISVLKVDGSDETVLNADTGDSILLSIAGTTELTVGNDSLTYSGAAGTLGFGATSGAFAIAGTAEMTLTNDQLAVSGAAFQIVPGATSFSIRNNADAVDNLLVTDAGVVTAASSLNTGGDLTVSGANLDFFMTDGLTFDSDFTTMAGDNRIKTFSNGNVNDGIVMGTNSANTNDVRISFVKTRANGTTDANTVVGSADRVGSIWGFAADGTSYGAMANISFIMDGTPGTTDLPGSIVFNTSPDGSATVAQVLKLGQDKAATFAGALTSTATGALGWSVVAGANTACNTTCTNACVVGQDSGSSNIFVDCADATADVCVCAGAS